MKISVLDYEGAILDPQEQYSEYHRAWQGVPSIARTRGGRLFLGYMSGGILEPDPRNCGIAQISDDDGKTWSDPVLVLESIPEKRLRHMETQFWIDPDGKLHLLWVESPYVEGLPIPAYAERFDMENESPYHLLEGQNRQLEAVCDDPDADELVFGEVRVLFNGVMRNRPFVSETGRWFYPSYVASPRDHYEFYVSDDKGKTLNPVRCPGRHGVRNFDEPEFYQTKDGAVAVLLRQRDPVAERAVSHDDGKTWSIPEPFYKGASERPCAINLRDGRVAMVTSVDPGKRTGLRLWLSEDGNDFRPALTLDKRARVSYPELIEKPDGTLFAVWDRERNNKIRQNTETGTSDAAKEVLFARIPPEALDGNGEIEVSVVSKARIDLLENEFTR